MENDCETDVKDYGDNPPKDDTAVAAEMPMKGSTDNLVRRRKQKIQEHLAVTLDSPNTSQACLGPVMCDLLEWCQELKGAIDAEFAAGPSSVARFEELTPPMETYLKFARQAERLAKVECRINDSRRHQNDE